MEKRIRMSRNIGEVSTLDRAGVLGGIGFRRLCVRDPQSDALRKKGRQVFDK